MEQNCKLVPYSVIIKVKGGEKVYQDALEASCSFNKRLLRERKMRIPFIDSQTRVAQGNSLLWVMEYQRTKPIEVDNGQVYVYPNKKWYKHRRLQIDPTDHTIFPNNQPYKSQQHYENNLINNLNENSNSMDSFQFFSNIPSMANQHHHHHHHHHSSSNGASNQVLTKQSSVPNDDYDHHGYSNHAHHHGHDDSFENIDNIDHDNDSDQDELEDPKKKKKRGKPRKKNDFGVNGDDKPFVCDRCGVKYKTKPGLTYHIQKAHTKNKNGSNSNTNVNITMKQADIINPDENTNSMFETGYDDMNSSSSLPQVSSNKNLLNKCGICIGSEQEVKLNQQEKLVGCSECNKSFHPSCLSFSITMIQSVKKYNWQCIDCKKCTHCGNSENDDKLLFCDDCDRGYHMYCLKPPLLEAPDGDWRCELCVKHLAS